MAGGFGVDPFQAFQFGQQVAGTSALGDLVRNVTQRLQSMDLLRAQTAYKYQSELPYEMALAKYKADISPEGRMYSDIFGTPSLQPTAAQAPTGNVPFGQQAESDVSQRITAARAKIPAGSTYGIGGLQLKSSQLSPEEVVKLTDAQKIKPVTGLANYVPFWRESLQQNSEASIRNVAGAIKDFTQLRSYLDDAVRSRYITQGQADQIYSEKTGQQTTRTTADQTEITADQVFNLRKVME